MDFAVARRKMVQDQLAKRGIRDPRVLEAMLRVPRHEFVDPGVAGQAYEDHPLAIGFRQTISQPYMVAFMTESLKLKGEEKVLEIGTGSGYQTAILCELVKKVWSIERIKDLSNRARKTLYKLGYFNFELRIGDGTTGWKEAGPFDVILAAAGCPSVPAPYREQLAEGGMLILPVGGGEEQTLMRITRRRGRFSEESLGSCRFVKLFGEFGWQEEA